VCYWRTYTNLLGSLYFNAGDARKPILGARRRDCSGIRNSSARRPSQLAGSRRATHTAQVEAFSFFAHLRFFFSAPSRATRDTPNSRNHNGLCPVRTAHIFWTVQRESPLDRRCRRNGSRRNWLISCEFRQLFTGNAVSLSSLLTQSAQKVSFPPLELTSPDCGCASDPSVIRHEDNRDDPTTPCLQESTPPAENPPGTLLSLGEAKRMSGIPPLSRNHCL
jgi:hypothetical protein